MTFFLGRMYFTGNDCYQNFVVFAPMLSSLNSKKKVFIGHQTEYYQKKLNHLILILNQPYLIYLIVD